MARSTTRSLTRPARAPISKVVWVLCIIFVVVGIAAAVVAYKVVNDFVRSWAMTPLDGSPVIEVQPTQLDAQGTPIPGGTTPLQQVDAGVPAQSWDGASRVTLLLIGLDYRDWEAGNVPRSDTMMLVTLDPLSKTAGMMSVPRDLWVNIPKVNTYGKINQAYYFGELYKLPGGGPALATETVRNALGVPINFYAQVDFSTFEKLIDIIGGVNVTVDQEMDIDPLGKGNTVHLVPGRVHLTGAMALGYARARYTNGGDFDRAKRQQAIVEAIQERILRYNTLPTLIANAPAIYKEVSNGIRTNLSLDQVIKLAISAIDIKKESIKKGVIGPNETEFAKSPDGLDILIPKPDKIRLVRDEVFTSSGAVSPAALTKDEKTLISGENARVILRNGSTTTGVANQTSDYLKKVGLNITATNNADRAVNDTTITVYNGKPYTLNYLAKLMNVASARIVTATDATVDADIVVTLGNDWAKKNPMSTK